MKRLACLLFLVLSCDTTTSSSTDLRSTDFSLPPMTDGAGTLQFGDMCSVPGSPGDCAPGLICDMFLMNTIHRCTRLCDQNPNPTNCPAPSDGTCNGKGECKFLQ